MIGYIYITTNIVNNKNYIGKKESSEFVETYLGSGVLLKKAILKYGRKNFKTKILEWCDTLCKLNDAEKKWIDFFDAVNRIDYYNIAIGGCGGDTMGGLAEEERLKINDKISKRQLKSWTYDRRLKMSNAAKERWQDDTYRNKFKTSSSGENHHMFNKHHSEETRQKMSESKKGKMAGSKNPMYGKKNKWGNHTDESIDKMINSSPHKHQVMVINIETGENIYFRSIRECAKYFGSNTKTINKRINGDEVKRNTKLNSYIFKLVVI